MWGFESDHSKSRNIWNPNFLKVGFQMVRFSNGRALAMDAIVITIWKPESNTYSIEIFPVFERLVLWFYVWYSDCDYIFLSNGGFKRLVRFLNAEIIFLMLDLKFTSDNIKRPKCFESYNVTMYSRHSVIRQVRPKVVW